MKKAGKNTPKIRILVADDHPLLREGVVQRLNREPDMAVCGEAGTAEEAFGAAERLNPDLLVTDLSFSGKDGLELIKDIRAILPGLPVLVLSTHDESIYAERALRAGARGYVMKTEGPARLLEAVRVVLSGRVYVSEQMAARVLDGLSGARAKTGGSPISKLTDREFEVFRLIGEGKDAHKIGEQLHLSVKTVDAHRANIRGKLGLLRSTDLTLFAVRWVESGN